MKGIHLTEATRARARRRQLQQKDGVGGRQRIAGGGQQQNHRCGAGGRVWRKFLALRLALPWLTG
ncbi:hypothetical protein COCVIDRAFT_85799 [Bipolaris victoriae FI3]|uniref:Uncharacterized protein n=1 Tax=Bipolaris victoriae (strain FI3) TaxID=930091 RepID=W7EVI6_BIPV3|nr:hypothetical protein COCVIDRAFT_85799 [Bipolaris victoriae FI3]